MASNLTQTLKATSNDTTTQYVSVTAWGSSTDSSLQTTSVYEGGAFGNSSYSLSSFNYLTRATETVTSGAVVHTENVNLTVE